MTNLGFSFEFQTRFKPYNKVSWTGFLSKLGNQKTHENLPSLIMCMFGLVNI